MREVDAIGMFPDGFELAHQRDGLALDERQTQHEGDRTKILPQLQPPAHTEIERRQGKQYNGRAHQEEAQTLQHRQPRARVHPVHQPQWEIDRPLGERAADDRRHQRARLSRKDESQTPLMQDADQQQLHEADGHKQ